MKLNQQLLQINRNFLICFLVSASISAITAQLLGDVENSINTTITIAIGYTVYFGIFTVLFYLDNRERFTKMKSQMIRKEVFSLISSFGIAEIIYLGIRWPSLFYFLGTGIEPYLASLISEIISTGCYMLSVTIFLRKMKTYG